MADHECPELPEPRVGFPARAVLDALVSVFQGAGLTTTNKEDPDGS